MHFSSEDDAQNGFQRDDDDDDDDDDEVDINDDYDEDDDKVDGNDDEDDNEMSCDQLLSSLLLPSYLNKQMCFRRRLMSR